MSDALNSESVAAISDLTEWLNSSLCSCVIDRSAKDEIKKPEVEPNERKTYSVDSTALSELLVDGRVFLWLIHSYKPDLVSPPQLDKDLSDEDGSNVQQAFKVAQEELGVQSLLVTGDFGRNTDTAKPIDSLVLLTYLIRFKYAVGNTQPACSNWPSRINISWNCIVKNGMIFLRPLAESPKCGDCAEIVLIMDRFLLSSLDQKDSVNIARHRRCFRCARCQKLLRIGLYRSAKSGTGYECLEHEKEDLVNRLTPAPEPKANEPAREEPNKENEHPSMYPAVPAHGQGDLYPKLASPEEKEGTGSSSPKLTSPVKVKTDQLSPPVPTRSRSSERDVPTPAPRKSKHIRGGSDVADSNVSPSSVSPVSPSSKPTRPARPSAAAQRPAENTVHLRRDYPDDLNPFELDAEPPARRHSSATPNLDVDKAMIDQRRSMAVTAPKQSAGAAAASTKDADGKTYDGSLNPFGSDSESDEGEAKHEDDASSLSSTNPFNESDEEENRKPAGRSEDSKVDVKKAPPPRPPPPSRVAASVSPAAKETGKKRPAPPPPPPSQSGVSGPPPRPASPKKQYRKKRQAPPRPLPLKRQIRTESDLSPEKLSEAFSGNEQELMKIESNGAQFETNLRRGVDERGFANVSTDIINEWISLVHHKFEFVRKETELVYMCRERQLDELHAEIEYQLRCVIEKPESEKTPEDMEREASLLQRMLDVIEEKSKLVDSQDELRVYTGTLPRNSIQLDDTSSGGASKASTLEDGRKGGQKQAKKKKKIKLRLKKLKEKIATSTLLHHSS